MEQEELESDQLHEIPKKILEFPETQNNDGITVTEEEIVALASGPGGHPFRCDYTIWNEKGEVDPSTSGYKAAEAEIIRRKKLRVEEERIQKDQEPPEKLAA